MLTKLFSMRRIVVGYDDGVIVDPNIAIEGPKEVLGQMASIPLIVRWSQSLPELMNGGLRN